MSKKLLSVTVHGKEKTWGFNFYGDTKYLDEWRSDGLEVVEILNTIPQWVVDLNLINIWCFFQDIWNFKNPFSK